jgi:ammonium transporter, Amt family
LSFLIRPGWMAEAARKAGAWSAWNQLGVQASGLAITIFYAGLMTLVLVIAVNKAMGFRLDEKDEVVGMDQSLHGERGYGLQDTW